ncbi:hypothetical protein SAMN04487949_1721 [Halogranum gelatinilyticum]|uniref:Uncharacterized protein n=1 Tax=Halogranum gelatinilyticum TaxID=660521 RepID=A0A1G9TCT0_9EURY|nr:hypothetical protein [Halogranum gelatinilyticum]SDM45549.1 hypothetical protein SAMN04487949_1721 [Halogranum gelatinilyticum]
MVGPSYTDDERRTASLRLKVGFVLVVGVSAGITALQVQGSLLQAGVFTVVGLLLGWILVVYLSHIVPSTGR